jgi:hypothetical protein
MSYFNPRKTRYLPIVTLLAAAALQPGIASAAGPRNDAQAQAGALLRGARFTETPAATLTSGSLAVAALGMASGQREHGADSLDPQAQARRLIVGSGLSRASEGRKAAAIVGFDLAASRSGAGDPQRHARDLILGHGV